MFSVWLVIAMNNPWAAVTTPTAGPAEPIGRYSAGCIQGAEPLPLQGKGYQVLRPDQHRYYGHPELLSYLHDLIHQATQSGLPPLLIGDMAMARGGPFQTGHASHQTGLDADIWFRFGQPALTPAELMKPMPIDMVRSTNDRVNERFTSKQATLLRLAASDERVNRIFVHPAIKLALCEQTQADREWLHKMRPWFGHRAHFHVRLNCPANANNCEIQAPIPAGDGCGAELMSWFKPQTGTPSQPKPRTLPELPGQCADVLKR